MVVDERERVSLGSRVFALASLACGAGLIIAVIWLFIIHGKYVLLAAIGLALGSGGGWWVISKTGVRRAIGMILIVVGLAVTLTAIVKAISEPDSLSVQFALLCALVAVTFGCARLAFRHDVRALEGQSIAEGGPPRHPVLICNPWSGGGKVEKFKLAELANELGVETLLLDHGVDLEQMARDAVARGADCLGMAGGDGSQALVASVAVDCNVPFVCISAGTRNHFALDLGIDRVDPRKSIYAFRDAIERRIDYATVGDRFFVNNVSLGIYATIVQQDEYRDAKVETTAALLPELLGDREDPFDLEFTEPDGTVVKGAYLIQVSNNPYVLGPALDVSQRRRMDTGQLGIFAVTGSTGAEAAAVVTLTALGQRKLSPNWHEFTSQNFEVRSQCGFAYAGVDGEALKLKSPISFSIHPKGLRLLVPKGVLLAADRKQSRQVSIRDLVAIVRGIDPRQPSTR